MEGELDLVVVGAGILGLAVACEMQARHPGLSIGVLEREAQIARGQTGANSGVIHAGIYYAPGSLKARLCVKGARDLYEFCDRSGVPYEKRGKLIVATDESQLPVLDDLERRGVANGVSGLARLSASQIRDVEPNVRGVGALHSAATGIVDFAAVTAALAEQFRAGGGVLRTGFGISAVDAGKRRLRLSGGEGEVSARGAIFCVGLAADRLAVAAGGPADPRIVPFLGRYLKLRPDRVDLVHQNIYPVPDPRLPFLGMHLTPTISGEVLLGPSALLGAPLRAARDPGTWRMARQWWRTGLREMRLAASRRAFVAELRRFVPDLAGEDCVPGPVGVRAQALGRDGVLLDDFAFSTTERAVHVRNAPSPAATASLAIARLIADRAERDLSLS